jgi:NTP pyrophosphatase (non-canonical NTP hydrolase)
MINALSFKIHDANRAKGFYTSDRNIGELLALIHSEVSEALEAHRADNFYSKKAGSPERYWYIDGMADKDYGTSFNDDKVFKQQFEKLVKNTFEDELADIMIRVMDLAAYTGVNLESHVKAKMRYNKLRPHKHGKQY